MRKPHSQEKKLKNIKQSPRVSPNLHIAVDIPLKCRGRDAPRSGSRRSGVQPPVPNVTNPAPEYPYEARREFRQSGGNGPG